ncbi:Transcription initiation factor TFIID subunit [Lachnellula suecica]|uniref:Transcription initiation factor TFIID subunit 8 n=1 Tax=Lachnellula suecica TaxID=602035 RepID=A0A8T9C0W6_9HELO|nr:Transcription initiation factor TFIID subunit [Lachnellula suecica]
MAPISPISRKRSTPSHSDDDISDEPLAKRARFSPVLPNTPPPEEALPIKQAETHLFNDDPDRLLMRSLALVLEHVGFDGATPEALESFASEVETYASHFLAKVATAMHSDRRSQPTPIDFEYALGRFDLTLASIEPHLRPPIAKSRLQIQLEAEPPEEKKVASLEALLGKELSGESDKKVKRYIPKRFPSFPSKHTYKWTEKESARETDPRKIREEATKAAKQGEEALRRLVNVSKAGNEKDVKKNASKDPKSKQRFELWEQAVETLLVGKPPKPEEKDDRSMIVNSDRQYFRKGALAKKKKPPPALEDTIVVSKE